MLVFTSGTFHLLLTNPRYLSALNTSAFRANTYDFLPRATISSVSGSDASEPVRRRPTIGQSCGANTPFWWGRSDSSDVDVRSEMPAEEVNTPRRLKSKPPEHSYPFWSHGALITPTVSLSFCMAVKLRRHIPARVSEDERTVKATDGPVIHIWWG